MMRHGRRARGAHLERRGHALSGHKEGLIAAAAVAQLLLLRPLLRHHYAAGPRHGLVWRIGEGLRGHRGGHERAAHVRLRRNSASSGARSRHHLLLHDLLLLLLLLLLLQEARLGELAVEFAALLGRHVRQHLSVRLLPRVVPAQKEL